MERATLLYDADCGFCRWSLSKLLAWDRRGRLRSVPLQSSEAYELLPPMTPERKMASWHLVTADGTTYSAGAAAPELLRRLPGGRPLAALAAAFPKSTDRLYRSVSDHRDRLAAMVGQRACSVDPQRMRAASGDDLEDGSEVRGRRGG